MRGAESIPPTILLGAQVDFALMSQYRLGGVAVVTVLMLAARSCSA
jgi:NhaP-type Na+/H+ or K+/H+ antiporter